MGGRALGASRRGVTSSGGPQAPGWKLNPPLGRGALLRVTGERRGQASTRCTGEGVQVGEVRQGYSEEVSEAPEGAGPELGAASRGQQGPGEQRAGSVPGTCTSSGTFQSPQACCCAPHPHLGAPAQSRCPGLAMGSLVGLHTLSGSHRGGGGDPKVGDPKVGETHGGETGEAGESGT